MSNIFSKTNIFVDKPNRNTFDLSFQNNATFEFGKLYPVLCKEVLPGDSFNIDATFGLKFMPFYWPVQTRMKANLHFFYVRRRNLWKDFVDFWGNTKDGLVPPYLSFRDRTMLQTGELADYLGIPTNLYGEFGDSFSIDINYGTISGKPLAAFSSSLNVLTDGGAVVFDNTFSTRSVPEDAHFIGMDWSANFYPKFKLVDKNKFYVKIDSSLLSEACAPCVAFKTSSNIFAFVVSSLSDDDVYYLKDMVCLSGNSLTTLSPASFDDFDVTAVSSMYVGVLYAGIQSDTSITLNLISFKYSQDNEGTTSYEISEYDNLNPYLPSNSNGKVLISAEPFRAYEAIYNAFYRNAQNNPYILNGVKEYNKFIPTTDGGLDDTSYKLHFRNWEQDFLTTATQTPQQGDFAPLVGITSTGQMTFQDNEGNTYKAYADVDDDGTIKGLKIGETGLPAGTLHALVDSISTGISINDFRNVNSLQRWLEKNLRRGYRFKDQIMSHFGVDVRYDELDMPEFIGGCSQDVNVNQISNTNGDGDVPLGDYAGQASCVGTTRNAVSHYFDEPGYVMAIMSITPVPNYSQLLPKYLIKRNLFDYYFPEFGHIGMQPILMNEVCPVQQYSDDPTKLNNVFGYQRAWYDYLASVDEVHGYFRTELRNFLINRRFDVAPELSESFLLCDPSQINDVFQVTDKTHKILGQIYFDIKAKRPIPEFGIPKLE